MACLPTYHSTAAFCNEKEKRTPDCRLDLTCIMFSRSTNTLRSPFMLQKPGISSSNVGQMAHVLHFSLTLCLLQIQVWTIQRFAFTLAANKGLYFLLDSKSHIYTTVSQKGVRYLVRKQKKG